MVEKIDTDRDDNVVCLSNARLPEQGTEVNTYLVESLEDMLERAKSGNMLAMAVYCPCEDTDRYIYVGSKKISKVTMIGGVASLQAMMIKRHQSGED